MITSILNGSINNSNYEKESFFGFNIPRSIDGVESNVLNPINSWNNRDEYAEQAKKLANLFKDNFKSYGHEVEYLTNSGPIV